MNLHVLSGTKSDLRKNRGVVYLKAMSTSILFDKYITGRNKVFLLIE